MMNLIIEIGNTNSKFAVFEDKKLKDLSVFRNGEDDLSSISNLSYEKILLAGSGSIDENILEQISSKKKILFHPQLIDNIKMKYETPETLGQDRLVNASYAESLFPGRPSLVIDTGTCITTTFVNECGELLGGSISPGLDLRAKALNDYTANLPLMNIDKNHIESIIGRNTESSILSGIVMGCIYELERRIEDYNKIYADLNIIMTGGGTQFFENKLNCKIFADPYFTLRGLNDIISNDE